MRALRIFGFILAICAASCGSEESSVLSVYNYPNPCTPAQGTTLVLKYSVPIAGDLGLYMYIYDLAGAPVVVRYITKTVVANGIEIPWDVTNDRGEALAPGVYIFKVITEGVPGSLAAQNASHRLMVQ
ncbi:MAG: T9SS type A sorting domain-containing protein [Spirochaetota bacterium]|jgi:hypothetical protein|nr:T9SS type A sorting domain-containing protein [Spirochaetota bacterium]